MPPETSRLILASTSIYRKRLLARTGVAFEVVSPECDERPVPGLMPRELALRLAREKARSVSSRMPEAVVVGSDQLVELDGEVIGKPGSVEGAVRQLLRMAGRTHRLWTAVAVSEGDRILEYVDLHRMSMRALGEAEVREYVERDHPLDCAGSYKIESFGDALMERIEGDDPSAIEGLPLVATLRMLAQFGINP